MAERCNCDSSCGENRYHDAGDPGCRFSGDEEYLAYWEARQKPHIRKDKKMPKAAKVSDKLVKVGESFTVNMYDNGFMVEFSGRDKKEDWKSSKILVSSVDELIALIKEAAEMERDA